MTIKVGKNAGRFPSVASLYRALAEAEAAATDNDLPLKPKPVRIRRPEDPLTAEEIDLGERRPQLIPHVVSRAYGERRITRPRRRPSEGPLRPLLPAVAVPAAG